MPRTVRSTAAAASVAAAGAGYWLSMSPYSQELGPVLFAAITECDPIPWVLRREPAAEQPDMRVRLDWGRAEWPVRPGRGQPDST